MARREEPPEESPELGTGPAEPGASTASTATTAPSLHGLGRTLQRGAAISAFALFVTQSVSLLQTLAVARLLTPAEVGVFTAGTVLTNFLATVSEGGLKAALIQREKDVEDAADTVFWATVVSGVLIALGALAMAPVIGFFFGGRTAGLVAAATSGTVLINSLTNVPDGLMQRRFNFKRRLIVDPTTAISFAVAAVVFCALGYGVWGLVIGLYASQLATLIAVWSLAGWRPGTGRASLALWREMASFAFPLVVSQVFVRFRELLENALVGRWLGEQSLGLYRYGRRIAILPGTAVIQIASYVLFPAFSRISRDAVRFKRGFLRALTLLVTSAVPTAGVLLAIGEPLVVVLLGEPWRGAGVVMVGLAGYGPGVAMNVVGMEAIKGAGRSKLLNWLTATRIIIGLGLLPVLIPTLGLLGAAVAVSVESIVTGALSLALARSIVSVSLRDLVTRLLPPVAATAIALAATAALEHLVLHSDERAVGVGVLLLAVDMLVFAVIYLVVLRVLAPETVGEIQDGVRRLVARRRRTRTALEPEVDPRERHRADP